MGSTTYFELHDLSNAALAATVCLPSSIIIPIKSQQEGAKNPDDVITMALGICLTMMRVGHSLLSSISWQRGRYIMFMMPRFPRSCRLPGQILN